MKHRKVATLAIVSIFAVGGTLISCGTEDVTAQDMREWQKEAQKAGSSEEMQALEDEDSTALFTDCEGTVATFDEAVSDIPNPPYKGDEWRSTMDDAVGLFKGICPAMKDGSGFLLLMGMEGEFKKIDTRMDNWVKDVNKEFPKLNWNTDTYMSAK